MPLEEDFYEVLRISPRADEDTIDRVYRTLADRFHPDNPSTGDAEAYLRVTEAFETLSSPERRSHYDEQRERSQTVARFRLRARDFFDGVLGEQNRRLAVLCLLYRRRLSSHESPGRTLLDLEQLTGCTREELNSVLWYMCEKQWVKFGELTEYTITSDGFDVVESKIEERSEFRAFATLRYYAPHPDAEPAADR
jgi:curved DNA-binding protein CbpA